MSDDTNKVDEILDELNLGEGDTEPPFDSKKAEEPLPTEKTETADRLSRLNKAGAITDEEYEVLQSHFESSESVEGEETTNTTSEVIDFGEPIATSEGTDIDFSIIGIFKEIDTSKLLLPDHLDHLEEANIPATHEGGPGRTIVFLFINNHSDREITLWNKEFELIGSDKIAYNQQDCPVNEDKLSLGWRAGYKVPVSPDTRIKYACGAEMPVEVEEVRISGDCADDHTISITDEMRFPKSDLPATIDL